MNFKSFYLTESLVTENSLGQPIHSTEEGIKNFWNWFGSSKTVDSKGRPIVYFHGTSIDFDKFELPWDREDWDENNNDSDGWTGGNLGHGFYFTDDKNYAKRFGKVKEFYLKIDKMWDLRDEDEIKELKSEFVEMEDDLYYGTYGEAIEKLMKQNKYDGVIAEDVGGFAYGASEIMVPKAKQIKSTDNNGKFSNSDEYKK